MFPIGLETLNVFFSPIEKLKQCRNNKAFFEFLRNKQEKSSFDLSFNRSGELNRRITILDRDNPEVGVCGTPEQIKRWRLFAGFGRHYHKEAQIRFFKGTRETVVVNVTWDIEAVPAHLNKELIESHRRSEEIVEKNRCSPF